MNENTIRSNLSLLNSSDWCSLAEDPSQDDTLIQPKPEEEIPDFYMSEECITSLILKTLKSLGEIYYHSLTDKLLKRGATLLEVKVVKIDDPILSLSNARIIREKFKDLLGKDCRGSKVITDLDAIFLQDPFDDIPEGYVAILSYSNSVLIKKSLLVEKFSNLEASMQPQLLKSQSSGLCLNIEAHRKMPMVIQAQYRDGTVFNELVRFLQGEPLKKANEPGAFLALWLLAYDLQCKDLSSKLLQHFEQIQKNLLSEIPQEYQVSGHLTEVNIDSQTLIALAELPGDFFAQYYLRMTVNWWKREGAIFASRTTPGKSEANRLMGLLGLTFSSNSSVKYLQHLDQYAKYQLPPLKQRIESIKKSNYSIESYIQSCCYIQSPVAWKNVATTIAVILNERPLEIRSFLSEDTSLLNFYNDTEFNKAVKKMGEEVIEMLSVIGAELKILKLDNIPLSSMVTSEAVRLCPKITHLSLKKRKRPFEELFSVLEGCAHLKEIDFSDTDIKEEELRGLSRYLSSNPPSLEKVYLSENSISLKDFLSIITECKRKIDSPLGIIFKNASLFQKQTWSKQFIRIIDSQEFEDMTRDALPKCNLILKS